jgi:hypothetical protein
MCGATSHTRLEYLTNVFSLWLALLNFTLSSKLSTNLILCDQLGSVNVGTDLLNKHANKVDPQWDVWNIEYIIFYKV